MNDEGHVRYFRGWSYQPDEEVAAEVAAGLPMHSRALHGADGRLNRLEIYSGRELQRVDYYPVDDGAQVSATHRESYGDVPFMIHKVISTVRGLTWESVRLFGAGGEPSGRSIGLLDSRDRGLMEIELDESGTALAIEKYEWNTSGKLWYAAKYTGPGRFSSGHDFEAGESVALAEIMRNVTDPEFFERGLNLPRILAGTSIPDLG
jgi:hypothetical protein